MNSKLTIKCLVLLCTLITIPTSNLAAQCAWTSAERDPLLTQTVYAGDPGDISCSSDNTKAFIGSATRGIAEYDFGSNQLKSMGEINARVRKTLDLGERIVAVGSFTQITDSEGAKAISGVALFDKTSRTWSALGQGLADGEAKAVESIGTRLIVGGSFTGVRQADGTNLAVRGLAQFNTATGLWTKWGNGLVDGDVRAIAKTGDLTTSKIYVGGKFSQVLRADGSTMDAKNLVSYPAVTSGCRVGCDAEVSPAGFSGVGLASETESAVQALKFDALSGKLAVGGNFTSIPIGARSIMLANSIASLDVETNTFTALGGANGTVTRFAKQASNSRVAASKYLYTQADNYTETRNRRLSDKTMGSANAVLAVVGKVAKLNLATASTAVRSEVGAVGGDVVGLATCGTNEMIVGDFDSYNAIPADEGAGFCDAALLAVELSSFDVLYSKGMSTITWSTSSETNNSGFEIQRSVNGRAFEVLQFVDGFGNSSVERNYSFSDELDFNIPTNLAYRLKQIDYDGTAWFSDVVQVNNDLPVQLSLGQNYPNPFNPSTSISFTLPEAQNVKLEVFNSVGQLVSTIVDGNMEAGYQEVHFDASGLPSGVYVYSISSDFGIIQKSMTLQK